MAIDYDRQYVLGNLEQFFDEGDDARYSGEDNRTKAQKTWDMEFHETVPDDSLYYPKAYNHGAHVHRAIVKTFMATTDLLSVAPLSRKAREIEGMIARAQNDIANMKLTEISDDRISFIQDTAKQGIIDGDICGKAYWKRETRTIEETFSEGSIENSETGLLEEVIKTTEREEIIENRPVMEYVDREDLLWDTAAKKMGDVNWVMQINIEVTERELKQMAEQYDMDDEAVKEVTGSGAARKTADKDDSHVAKAKDNELIELIEFWGYISIKEGGPSGFYKIIADKDFKHLLLPPTNSEDQVYYDFYGKPVIPYVIGYLEKKKGKLEGESLMLKMRSLQSEENYIRNQIRRSAEQDLNSIFAIRRGSGIDANALKDRKSGGIVWTDDDIRASVAEFPHRDTTGSGFKDIQLLNSDWEYTSGVTPYNAGINDPSITETAMGINMMTNAANQNIRSKIEAYNESFLEPMLRLVLIMCVKYTTNEELQRYDIELPPNVDRKALMKEMRLRVDAGLGATSELAQQANGTKAYFMMQQRNQHLVSAGFVLPPKDLYAPAEQFNKMLPLLGVKDVEANFSTFEEIWQLTQQEIQKQAQQQAQFRAEAEADAASSGQEEAIEQMREQQLQAQQQGGA